VTEYRSDGVREHRNESGSRLARTFKELTVYAQAMDAAMELFQLTRNFQREEAFSLKDQVRRSSRSVCGNIGEAWRKRRYKAAFIAKLSDCEGEAAETQVWIEIARRCGYLSDATAAALDERYEGVLRQLVAMIDNAERWVIR